MSEQKAENMTNVAGYFNPQTYSIFIEISEVNLKTELAPGAYIRDRNNKYINDPIFEPYCHVKGLSRAKSEKPVPIIYVPRFVKPVRQGAAVTQASGFVREPGGRTVPTYPAQRPTMRETAINKTPITGMTMEAARKMGFVGKPKLIDENYGADETSGAPAKGGSIPPIRYSRETPPRIKTGASLRPELTEADEDLSPEEREHRGQLQRSLQQASATPTGDNFDPARVRPLAPVAPVAMKAPEVPTPITKAPPVQISPLPTKAKAKVKTATKPAAVKIAPARRVATPVEPEQPPIEEAQEVEPEDTEKAVGQDSERGNGVVEALDESVQESPVVQEHAPDEEGKRFICATDGKPFKFRSELERHVRRNYPEMQDELMAPYPSE